MLRPGVVPVAAGKTLLPGFEGRRVAEVAAALEHGVGRWVEVGRAADERRQVLVEGVHDLAGRLARGDGLVAGCPGRDVGIPAIRQVRRQRRPRIRLPRPGSRPCRRRTERATAPPLRSRDRAPRGSGWPPRRARRTPARVGIPRFSLVAFDLVRPQRRAVDAEGAGLVGGAEADHGAGADQGRAFGFGPAHPRGPGGPGRCPCRRSRARASRAPRSGPAHPRGTRRWRRRRG